MSSVKNFQVLIIGGGITGLSLARALRKRGVEDIAILEKNSVCGAEASSAAAGMLAPQAEADADDSFFQFCAESRDLYPQFAAELLDETGVDIELDRSGTLYLAFAEKDAEELEKRFAWQKKANLAVEKLSRQEILKFEPHVSPQVLSGLFFPNDWQVENRKIIESLNKQLTGNALNKYTQGNAEDKIQAQTSGEFFRREVTSLICENNQVVGVETDLEKFYASEIVVTSGAWTSLIEDEFHLLKRLEIKPIRGQMISFGGNCGVFRHVLYSHHGYVVPRKDCRILVGATVEDAGFESRTTGTGIASLLETAFRISPVFENLSLKKNWAGLRPLAADGLPVLGKFPNIENLYVATGHYRNGILLAPKTAEIMADEITGNNHSEYLEIFSPQRFAVGAGKIVTNFQ